MTKISHCKARKAFISRTGASSSSIKSDHFVLNGVDFIRVTYAALRERGVYEMLPDGRAKLAAFERYRAAS